MSKHESATPESKVAVHRRAFKYRIYPTKAQIEFLSGQLREACSLYNCALEERIGAWKTCRKSINLYDQSKQIPVMRKDGCLSLVNAQCAGDILRRLDRAFTAFFVRVKRGDKPGFPRYRSFRRYDSLTYPHYGNGCKILDTGKLRIQGAGHIKIKLHRPVEGKIKTCTIKREIDKWFVIFSCEVEPRPLTPSNEAVGIDVGLTAFATLSDGTKIPNPRHFNKASAHLRRAHRKMAHRKKGSARRRKAAVLVAKANRKIQNQRADFHHKVSRSLVNQFGLIAIEDLNVQGLASGMLAKSVNDAGWSQFFSFLAYKAEYAGRQFVKVDPRGTSQTCTCGARVPKTLDDRWHSCPSCGASCGRDHMSAQVILQRARNAPPSVNVGVVMPCVGREAVAA